MLAVKRHRGFSLVELMVVTSIAAILLGVAVANLGALLRQQQLRTALGDMFGAIDLTRSHAIALGRRVYMTPTATDWRDGWTVFVDADGDGRPSAGDKLVAVHGPLADGIAVRSTFTSPATPDYISYNGGGRSCSHASTMAARWGTLSLSTDGQVRRIKINMLGRARACNPALDGASCTGADPP
ncbi:GspH/FimT family pseudopilin [Massilia cavernae]|uniref:Type II secretion system protein H n=1 Tax=Massilia cavernae TaxID=2320864 RepID=A0A418XV95_9BURK|nr:GspH/FimT family pseudopilin [Massilia cavernae]RJG16624.1 prepilin-type N-terminal cleavage/methylation domain-containing protein [Massilia cavernae]